MNRHFAKSYLYGSTLEFFLRIIIDTVTYIKGCNWDDFFSPLFPPTHTISNISTIFFRLPRERHLGHLLSFHENHFKKKYIKNARRSLGKEIWMENCHHYNEDNSIILGLRRLSKRYGKFNLFYIILSPTEKRKGFPLDMWEKENPWQNWSFHLRFYRHVSSNTGHIWHYFR